MTLNYTPLRHRMLAAVERGYVAAKAERPYFDFSRVHVSTPSQCSRAFNDLWEAGLVDVFNDDRIELSDAGTAQFTEWTARHGEPR